MKLAKFIYPMFLVALGLHGLLLFVPVGGASEAELIEEDVELSELPTSADANPADAKAKAALNAPVGPLPVPSLNISTGATPANPATTAAAVRAAPRVAVRQPVAGAAPRARTTTQSAARPASGRSSQHGAGTSDSPGTASAGSASVAMSAGSESSQTLPQSQESRNNTPRTNLPNLNAASESSTDSASAGRDRNVSGTVSLSRLIASVTNSAPEALQSLRSDFAKDYAYVDKNTDAAGLADRRSRWIDKISLLASADSHAAELNAAGTSAVADKIEPALSNRKLIYPIEHSARPDRRASRVCLDDPLPNDPEVAVLFDDQGRVIGTPEITLSSGYPAIDKEIIAIVLAEGAASDSDGLPETRQSKAYLYAFEIDYAADRCLTLPKLKK